jgi:hypothetical protein
MIFVRVGLDLVVAVDQIRELDCEHLEDQHTVIVTLRSGRMIMVSNQPALDLVMAVKPSAVEGKRFRFARRAWAFHNLVAHPALQVLSWFGLHRLGFKIHDATVPKPRGSV